MEEKYIPFKNQKEMCLIPVSEVLYVMQDKRKIRIVTNDTEYVEYGKVNELNEYLTDDFFSCLKHTKLNLEQVKGFVDQSVIFKNGESLKLGRDCFNRTRKEFMNYVKRKLGLKFNKDEEK